MWPDFGKPTIQANIYEKLNWNCQKIYSFAYFDIATIMPCYCEASHPKLLFPKGYGSAWQKVSFPRSGQNGFCKSNLESLKPLSVLTTENMKLWKVCMC